jgi:hypothetical protein
MDSWLVLAPLAVAVLGLFGFGAGLVHAVKLRPGRATAGLGGGGILAIGGLAVGLIGLNVQGYARLTHEVVAAEVTVHAVDAAQKTYTITVERRDGVTNVTNCRVQGDSWEIGGSFQKWKAWANIIGLDATYKLEQITNRYDTAGDGNGQPITACDLNGAQPEANQYLPSGLVSWMIRHLVVEDRKFGSAVYMPLVDGAQYKVIVTQFALNAEADNDVARSAVAAH